MHTLMQKQRRLQLCGSPLVVCKYSWDPFSRLDRRLGYPLQWRSGPTHTLFIVRPSSVFNPVSGAENNKQQSNRVESCSPLLFRLYLPGLACGTCFNFKSSSSVLGVSRNYCRVFFRKKKSFNNVRSDSDLKLLKLFLFLKKHEVINSDSEFKISASISGVI